MLEDILRATAEANASDLHLHVGVPPMVRIAGKLVSLTQFEVMKPASLLEMAESIFRPGQKERFEEGEEIDTSLGIAGLGRFRCNIFKQRSSVGLVLRRVATSIPSFDELGLPPTIEYLTRFHDGLVLVTGITGSGKSTTLAAMIDKINIDRSCHIVTLEDPIEFLHNDKNSIVTQREIGQDTLNFGNGLRSVLRQDPDVILIGEMRDPETIQAAITAAETGHLVLSTLHTTNAPQTIDRILEYFNDEMRHIVRQQLSEHIRGVVSQRLIPKIDGTGMIPAVEVMLMNPLVKKMILEDKLGSLKSVIHAAANEGMQTFDLHLVALYNAGLVKFEDAAVKSSNPENFHLFCQGFFSDIIQGIIE